MTKQSDFLNTEPSTKQEEMVGGLPHGTTVALVGDPGTGKTTFLLEYYKQALVADGQVQFKSVHPLKKLDNLLRRAKQKQDSSDILRCFVSLESSFPRMLATHGAFFPPTTKSSTATPSNKDKYVFIDATSFLSGRVEDEVRYPRLSRQGHINGPDVVPFVEFNFSMEGETLGGSALRFLDESAPNAIRPRELGELNMECTQEEHTARCTTPFCLKHPFRVFMLLTRPLPDPQVRIRLLKDLLAELFSRFKNHSHRLVVIDSLSALLDSFVDEEATREPGGRRLHILNLIRWLEELGVTTLFSSEAVRDGGHTLRRQPLFLGTQERYLAAGVIQLDYHQYRSGDLIRYFRILKMRGASHDMRPHAYDISQEGIAWVEPLFGEMDEEGI
ncbi:MAG: hypothetical protein HQL90_13265 [Magnetococcales bacterium]|nr:hypothetical protein [Magnetococcales bacterium]